jgi:uncharacterized DUF497 family protein
LGRCDRRGGIVIPPSGYAIMRDISVFKSGNDLELAFEWDKQKAKANQRKHSISFEEASTVFDDPLAVNFDDPDHSTGENRYLIIGLSDQGKFLFVSYTDRNNKIRLISARLVTPKERRYYERENPR